MIKKAELKSFFEYYVTHRTDVETPLGILPVLTWLITLNENTKRIHLNAVTRFGLFSVASSFPFGSYKSAYHFMVRL